MNRQGYDLQNPRRKRKKNNLPVENLSGSDMCGNDMAWLECKEGRKVEREVMEGLRA
jgi:hypothetical protein